jgi:hypothetical protein
LQVWFLKVQSSRFKRRFQRSQGFTAAWCRMISASLTPTHCSSHTKPGTARVCVPKPPDVTECQRHQKRFAGMIVSLRA